MFTLQGTLLLFMHTSAAPSGLTCEIVYEEECVRKLEEICEPTESFETICEPTESYVGARQARKRRPEYQTSETTKLVCKASGDCESIVITCKQVPKEECKLEEIEYCQELPIEVCKNEDGEIVY